MKFEKFIEFLLKTFPEKEYDGIRVYWSGEYYNIKGNDVPVYRIDNPNNVAYTYEAIAYRIEEEIMTLKKFLPDISVPVPYLYQLDCDGLYVPQSTLNKITKCLKGKEFKKETSFNTDNGVKTISIDSYYDGNYYISNEDDSIIWEIDLHVKKMWITLPDGTVEDITNVDDDMDSNLDLFNDLLRDYADTETWDCVEDDLGRNDNFVNFSFMGWYTHFRLIS